MAVLTAINANTVDNMQLDAGVIISKAYDPTKDVGGSQLTGLLKSNNIGATKGATTFSATPEIRNIFDGIDGVRGDIKNGNVIDKWEVSLKTSVTAFTLSNLKLALGATTKPSGASEEKFEVIEPGDEIAESDYIDITWLGTMAKGKDPLVITLRNCLNINGLTITAEDKNTGLIEIELRAHIDLAALSQSKKQFTLYLPKNEVQLPSRKAEIKELDK